MTISSHGFGRFRDSSGKVKIFTLDDINKKDKTSSRSWKSFAQTERVTKAAETIYKATAPCLSVVVSLICLLVLSLISLAVLLLPGTPSYPNVAASITANSISSILAAATLFYMLLSSSRQK